MPTLVELWEEFKPDWYEVTINHRYAVNDGKGGGYVNPDNEFIHFRLIGHYNFNADVLREIIAFDNKFQWTISFNILGHIESAHWRPRVELPPAYEEIYKEETSESKCVILYWRKHGRHTKGLRPYFGHKTVLELLEYKKTTVVEASRYSALLLQSHPRRASVTRSSRGRVLSVQRTF